VADHPFNWRQTMQRRILVVAGALVLWTLGVEARLVYLQVIAHEELVALAENQWNNTSELPAKRGEIVDRRGRLLAYSVDADTVYAVPTEIKDPARTAAALCAVLEECAAKERATLTERLTAKRPFTYIRRRVSPLETRKVAALGLHGIGFMKESRRFYPNKELAAHLLGYVGLDNVGLSGVEAAYDKVIRGKSGRLITYSDARRRSFGGRVDRAPTSGGSLELTIDEQLQYLVERELRAGVEERRADGGTAVVMDPHTGEILALASWPTFNPNAFGSATEAARRNRAVQDIYEPGSTFKVVTIAAALEEQVMSVDTVIDTSPGIYRIGRWRVIDEFQGHNYGALSLADVIVKSSNVGAVKIGLKVGAERLGLYAQRFGFGRPTSPDFPSESPGILWPAQKLNEDGLASMSMGYQVSVTSLQMAAAMSAVANGGEWIEPRIVRAVIRDGVRTKIEPQKRRRVISEETAARMRPILEKVVTDGTAKLAKLAGYTVAGKTGTADKLVNGHYVGHMQNVSFLGFVPSENPALTVIVMIDTPRVGSDTGGAVAAPIFKRIAEGSMRLLGVAPTIDPAPPIYVARRQDPLTDAPASTPTAAHTSSEGTPGLPGLGPLNTTTAVDTAFVPDLRGSSARDALRRLARLGLSVRVEGSGVVVSQTPGPGTPVEPGVTCTLVLDRDKSKTNGAVGEHR
jgi:cell division protein FtsI (penicillin-binding protein 3)